MSFPASPNTYPIPDNLQRSNYEEAIFVNDYDMHSGVLILPIAAAPPTDPEQKKTWKPFVVARVHQPYRQRKLVWRATKNLNPPICPSPEDSGRFTFVGGTVSIPTPTPNQDGTSYKWSAEGTYIFAEGAAHDLINGFTLGNPSFAPDQQLYYESVVIGAPPTNPYTIETKLGPLRGEAIASQINFTNPFWGLQPYGGVYNEISYFPCKMMDTTMVSGGITVTPMSTT